MPKNNENSNEISAERQKFLDELSRYSQIIKSFEVILEIIRSNNFNSFNDLYASLNVENSKLIYSGLQHVEHTTSALFNALDRDSSPESANFKKSLKNLSSLSPLKIIDLYSTEQDTGDLISPRTTFFRELANMQKNVEAYKANLEKLEPQSRKSIETALDNFTQSTNQLNSITTPAFFYPSEQKKVTYLDFFTISTLPQYKLNTTYKDFLTNITKEQINTNYFEILRSLILTHIASSYEANLDEPIPNEILEFYLKKVKNVQLLDSPETPQAKLKQIRNSIMHHTFSYDPVNNNIILRSKYMKSAEISYDDFFDVLYNLFCFKEPFYDRNPNAYMLFPENFQNIKNPKELEDFLKNCEFLKMDLSKLYDAGLSAEEIKKVSNYIRETGNIPADILEIVDPAIVEECLQTVSIENLGNLQIEHILGRTNQFEKQGLNESNAFYNMDAASQKFLLQSFLQEHMHPDKFVSLIYADYLNKNLFGTNLKLNIDQNSEFNPEALDFMKNYKSKIYAQYVTALIGYSIGTLKNLLDNNDIFFNFTQVKIPDNIDYKCYVKGFKDDMLGTQIHLGYSHLFETFEKIGRPRITLHKKLSAINLNINDDKSLIESFQQYVDFLKNTKSSYKKKSQEAQIISAINSILDYKSNNKSSGQNTTLRQKLNTKYQDTLEELVKIYKQKHNIPEDQDFIDEKDKQSDIFTYIYKDILCSDKISIFESNNPKEQEFLDQLVQNLKSRFKSTYVNKLKSDLTKSEVNAQKAVETLEDKLCQEIRQEFSDSKTLAILDGLIIRFKFKEAQSAAKNSSVPTEFYQDNSEFFRHVRNALAHNMVIIHPR